MDPELHEAALREAGFTVETIRPFPDRPAIYCLVVTGNGLKEPFKPLMKEGVCKWTPELIVLEAQKRVETWKR